MLMYLYTPISFILVLVRVSSSAASKRASKRARGRSFAALNKDVEGLINGFLTYSELCRLSDLYLCECLEITDAGVIALARGCPQLSSQWLQASSPNFLAALRTVARCTSGATWNASRARSRLVLM